MFDLIQSNEAKYNSYIYSFHPDWPYLKVHMKISNDPLDLKKWLNLATGIQLSVYTAMAFRLLVKRVRQAGESIFRTNDEILRSLRNMVFHIAIVVLIFTIVKLCFKALDNLASLSELAKKIGESSHHVSQVMNEKLNKSFFELLASYRIEEAKKILSGDKKGKITVEEVSEMVGYNSKTAFNNAFKKLSGKTPSEFRKSVNI
jgi:AraC-type DNA-binding domain-containing proteins